VLAAASAGVAAVTCSHYRHSAAEQAEAQLACAHLSLQLICNSVSFAQQPLVRAMLLQALSLQQQQQQQHVATHLPQSSSTALLLNIAKTQHPMCAMTAEQPVLFAAGGLHWTAL
jgi:hypothetical protein